MLHVEGWGEGNRDRSSFRFPDFAKFLLDRFRRGKKVVSGKSKWNETGGRFGLFGHEVKHFDACRIEGGDFNGTFGTPPVPSAARRNIDNPSAFLEKLAHLLHGGFIMELFFGF